MSKYQAECFIKLDVHDQLSEYTTFILSCFEVMAGSKSFGTRTMISIILSIKAGNGSVTVFFELLACLNSPSLTLLLLCC